MENKEPVELHGKFTNKIEMRSNKSRVVAALLAFFLGGMGIHKFYLGRAGWGIIYLLFSWTAIPMILGFIEGIIYLCMSNKAFESKYN